MADQLIDVTVADFGTVTVITGKTGIAKSHLEERMPEDVQMWGGGYVVEHRYVDLIVEDLLSHDFTVGAA